MTMGSSLPMTVSGSSLHSSNFLSTTVFKWEIHRNKDASLTNLVTSRRNGPVFRVSVLSNVSAGKNSKDNIVMVDPLEAKRLAAKQMQEIKTREKLKRQRQIEAINGAWAMIGLTAGLVIEGYTGNNIPEQLVGYWNAIISLFTR